LTGISATGSVGSVGIGLFLGGVSATGSVGNVKGFAWSIIDDNQSVTWQNINTV
jgi:hypothetical protein